MLEFSTGSMVLYYDMRLPRGMHAKRPRFLCWPALMYRAVAPEARQRDINILEKAVLGLCRAGATGVERIGARLHIDPDLAAEVVQQLQVRELLDSSGLPTERGNSTFEAEAYGPTNLVTGHVFQDPWSGALWPRFMEELAIADVEPGDGRYPNLLTGSTGDRRSTRMFWHLPSLDALPPPPGPQQVLEASRKHRDALRGAEIGVDEEAGRGDEPNFAVTAIERVSLVDDRPTAVMLVSYVFLLADEIGAGEWQARDPLGLGLSRRWKGDIEREMEGSVALREYVQRLAADGRADGPPEVQQWVSELEVRAELELDLRFTSAVRDLPQYPDLIALEVARQEARALDRAPQYKLKGLMVAIRSVLEATFAAVSDDYPSVDAWLRLFPDGRPISDREYCRQIFENSASELGYSMPLSEGLAGVQPWQVKQAGRGDVWRLRGAIIAALLTARDSAEHPLRTSAPRWPGMLNELDALATACGQAVHVGGGPVELDDALNATEKTFRIVGTLSGLATEPSEMNGG